MAASKSFGAFLQTCRAREKQPVRWSCGFCCALALDSHFLLASERGEIVSLEETDDRDIPQKFSSSSEVVPARVVALACLGATCTSGLENGTIQVWNCTVGKEIACHVVDMGTVTCLAMLSEAECIFGLASGRIGTWRYGLYKHSLLEDSHTASVSCVGTASSETCVTAGRDGVLIVWEREKNTGQFKVQARLQGHEGAVNCLLIVSTKRCISGAQDRSIRVWEDCRELARLEGHTGAVTCLVLVSPLTLASGAEDKTIRFWNLSSMKQRSVCEHKGSVTCVSVTNQGLCISGDSTGCVRLWDTDTGEVVAVFPGHTEAVVCLAVASNNQCLTGSGDCQALRWNCDQKKSKILVGHFADIKLIGGYGDSSCVLYHGKNTISHWDINKSSVIRSFEVEDANCMAEISNNQYILGGEGCLTVLDIITGQKLVKFDNVPELIRCIATIGDGRVVFGASDKTLRIWSLQLGELRVLRGHDGLVECVAVSRDNRRCVSGSGDYTLREWDLVSYKSLGVIGEHEAMVTNVAVLTSTMCASAAWDQTLFIWDTVQRIKLVALNELTGKLKYVLSLAVRRNTLLSGSSDGKVRVWDTAKLELVSTFQDHSGAVQSLAVSKDCYLSAASDGTVIQRDISEYFHFNNKRIPALLEIEAYHLTELIKGKTGSWAQWFCIREVGVDALHVLAYYNHAKQLSMLLKARPMLRGYYGSPLSLALERNTVDCVEGILKHCIEVQKSWKELGANVRAITEDIPELLSFSCPSLVPFFASLMQYHPRYPQDSFLCFPQSIECVESMTNLKEKEGEEKLLQVRVSMLKWNLTSGSSESLTLLKALADCDEKRLLATSYVEAVLVWKWKRIWPFILGHTVINIILLSLSLVCVFAPSPWTVWTFLTFHLVLLGEDGLRVSMALREQAKQAIHPFRLLCRLASVYWGTLLLAGAFPEKWLTMLVLALAFLQGVTCFQAFQATRAFVCVALQAIKDLWGLLSLISYIVLCLSALTVYQTGYRDNEYTEIGSWLVLVVGTLLCAVTMVSLLSALLGLTQSQLCEKDLHLQLQVMLEAELLQFWRRLKGKPVYVRTVKSVGRENTLNSGESL